MRSRRAKRMGEVLSYSVRKAAESCAAHRCSSWASSISGGKVSIRFMLCSTRRDRLLDATPRNSSTAPDICRTMPAPMTVIPRRPHLRPAVCIHRQPGVRNHHPVAAGGDHAAHRRAGEHGRRLERLPDGGVRAAAVFHGAGLRQPERPVRPPADPARLAVRVRRGFPADRPRDFDDLAVHRPRVCRRVRRVVLDRRRVHRRHQRRHQSRARISASSAPPGAAASRSGR